MDVSNIDVSLSQGQIFTKKHFIILYVGMVVSCLMPILTIVLLFLPEVEWEREFVGSVVLFNLFSLALLSLIIFLLIKYKRIKNKIRIWLEDAI